MRDRTQRRATTGQSTIDDLLEGLPTVALVCRELRHSWPHPEGANDKRFITFTVTKRRGNRVTEVERKIECTRGCGVTRREVFAVAGSGRLTRLKPAVYQHTKPYLLDRAKPAAGTRHEVVDRDRVRMLTFTRMFPDLKW